MSAETAYYTFREGFGFGADRPPEWSKLKSWMRDAMIVAYLQGKLDRKPLTERWIRDEKTNELFERQTDGSYRAAYKLTPLEAVNG